MKDAQKPDHVSLTNMITRLREGQFAIPDFQRDFEWEPWDINELMRSIFCDYYIGSLLLWKGKDENFDALSCEPIYGFEGTSKRAQIVLDGQQRLTAMYYAFMAPNMRIPSRQNPFRYFIKVDRFMEASYADAFDYYWTRQNLDLLEDRSWQFKTHKFPLSVLRGGGRALAKWLQGYEEYWQKAAEAGDQTESDVALRHAMNSKEFAQHIWDITEQYQISYIELDQDLELDKVCDIFTKINSSGRRLDIFDLLNALLKPKGLQLRVGLWRSASPRLEFADNGRMNVYVLQVMSILLQEYCSPKYLYYLIPGHPRQIRASDGTIRSEILVRDATAFKALWHKSVVALEKAINLLRHPQDYGAISAPYLPYASILPAFASLQAEAMQLPPHQRLGAQRKIWLWYWASVFTKRYSGAVESTTARDYREVKAWFHDDNAEPEPVGEFRGNISGLGLEQETRRGTSIYNGVFNLLVLQGARDWITGTAPQHGDLDDHHIVPKSWGAEHELQTPIDTILNRTPLTQETNRAIISDRLPNTYLPELIERYGEADVLSILETHFISRAAFNILMRDPFTPGDFEDFVAERQDTLLKRIRALTE